MTDTDAARVGDDTGNESQRLFIILPPEEGGRYVLAVGPDGEEVPPGWSAVLLEANGDMTDVAIEKTSTDLRTKVRKALRRDAPIIGYHVHPQSQEFGDDWFMVYATYGPAHMKPFDRGVAEFAAPEDADAWLIQQATRLAGDRHQPIIVHLSDEKRYLITAGGDVRVAHADVQAAADDVDSSGRQ